MVYDQSRDYPPDDRDLRGRDVGHARGQGLSIRGAAKNNNSGLMASQRPPTLESPRESLPSPANSAGAVELFPDRVKTFNLDEAIQHVVSLFLELSDLERQRTIARKNHGDTQFDYDRHRHQPLDFPQPVVTHLRNQSKRAEEVSNKLDSSFQTKGKALSTELVHIIESLPRSGPPIANMGPLCSHNSERAEVDARLASMEGSLQESLSERDSRLQQDMIMRCREYKSDLDLKALSMHKDMESVTEKFESRLLQLESRLEQETRRNQDLESELAKVREKVTELEQAVSKPPENCGLSEGNAKSIASLEVWRNNKQNEVNTLGKRVSQSESAVSQMTNTVSQLQKAAKEAKESEPARQALDSAVSSLQHQISSLPMDQLKGLPTAFSELKQEVQGDVGRILLTQARSEVQSRATSRGSPDSLPASLESRLQHVEQISKKWQDNMRDIAAHVGGMVDTSRQETDVQIGGLQSGFSELSTNVRAMSLELSTAKVEQNDFNMKIEAQMGELPGRIESVKASLDRRNTEYQAQFGVIHHTLQNHDAWQANFNTTPLYRDIVAHITHTMPNGVTKALQALKDRSDALEREVRNLSKRRATEMEEDPNKRRRVANGSPSVAY